MFVFRVTSTSYILTKVFLVSFPLEKSHVIGKQCFQQ